MTLNTQVTKAQVFEGTVWVQEKLSERFHQVDHLLLTNKLCTQVYNMYNTIYKQHTYIQHEGNTNIMDENFELAKWLSAINETAYISYVLGHMSLWRN